MSSESSQPIPSSLGDPTWEVAALWPKQGQWRETDFLEMHTNRMVELSAGCLEVLPMPTWIHQLIVVFMLEAIKNHLQASGDQGVVLLAPLPVKLFPGTIREPDLLYVAADHLPAKESDYPNRVDLVVEVVSEGAEARRRDYEHKRVDYAQAGVSEYWIVDPEKKLITVLGLAGNEYESIGEFGEGDTAKSRYLPGMSISVDDVMAPLDSQ